MNNNDKVILTPEGLEELKNELNNRLTAVREEIADEIEKAREQGDLSENAAYKAAMEDKEFNETRIEALENMIKNSVVKTSNPNNQKIDVGEHFKLTRASDNKEMEYRLVGSNEANPTEGKISGDSPIGKAVMGKKFGEEIEIQLPSGKEKFRINRIS